MRVKLTDQAVAVDGGYVENTDLVIDSATGKPSLKRRRAGKPATGELALEEAVKERMPERTLLEILVRTAYGRGPRAPSFARRRRPACSGGLPTAGAPRPARRGSVLGQDD